MALGKKITGDNGALVGSYHRIRMILTDFDKEQQHVYLAHYAAKSYRDQEKADMAANAALIDRYNELSAKQTLTDAERLELDGLNIQELLAFTPQPRTCQPDTKMTLPIGTDVREAVYEALGGEFENAKNV